MSLPNLFLKKREEKRIIAGHLWIYSNEVDTEKSPLKSFEAGQCVNIMTANGSCLGSAYVNPHSLIVARKYSENKNQSLDLELIKSRIQAALALRESIFTEPCYRLIFSEGDYLPGLIIDRFDSTFVLQLNTAGMEAVKSVVVEVLDELFEPKAIVLRNDTGSRQLESMDEVTEVIRGDVSNVICEENHSRFKIDVLQGQKTGWFYDQRINRKQTIEYCQNKSVLDIFSYTGSWAIPLALHGARQVTAIDVSQSALDLLQHNAELNGGEEKISLICDDAFNAMKSLKEQNKMFDVVIIDPPAFIKRKKDLKEGAQAYARANQLAMSLVKPGGLIISSSCSYHMSLASLQNALLKGSRKLKRPLQIIHYGGQGPDHPIHPAIEETNYLKTVFARVL